MEKNSKALPRAKFPEEVGVRAEVLKEITAYAEENSLEMHSLMVVRNGKVAIEWYNAPFDAKTPHAMYSVSKSVTATAIGFAAAEKLLSLDDLVVKFFPDYPPKKQHPYFEKMTVRTLLTMTSGKQTDMLVPKCKIDWIEDFINSPWVFEPGTDFLYVNENIFMLCAILQRVTGESVLSYLTPRLFEPLGIEVPFWETDPKGVEAGGWGLYLTTEDFTKFATCYLHGGKYGGKQVLPVGWAEQATCNQLGAVKQHNEDPGYESGYGYCFWVNETEDFSYRADGMFSQLALNFPSYDATVVLTAGISLETLSRQMLLKFFPSAFCTPSQKHSPAQPVEEAIGTVPTSGHPQTEQSIAGRTIRMRKKILLNLFGFPVSMLPAAVTYTMTDRAGNIDEIRFEFEDAACTIDWTESKTQRNSVVCGMDGHYRYGEMHLGGIDFKVCANAYWLDETHLKVCIRPLQTVARRSLQFGFHAHNRVTMKPSSTPSSESIGDTLRFSFQSILKNQALRKIAEYAIQFVPGIMDATQHGRFVD